jgi:hypothetical protein
MAVKVLITKKRQNGRIWLKVFRSLELLSVLETGLKHHRICR